MSFDVESPFTNVPIDAAVEAALQNLENGPSLADRTTLRSAKTFCEFRIETHILSV